MIKGLLASPLNDRHWIRRVCTGRLVSMLLIMRSNRRTLSV
jgi:hypothetical protein